MASQCFVFPGAPAQVWTMDPRLAFSTTIDNCTLLGVELRHGNYGIHPGTSIRRCEFAASDSSQAYRAAPHSTSIAPQGAFPPKNAHPRAVALFASRVQRIAALADGHAPFPCEKD